MSMKRFLLVLALAGCTDVPAWAGVSDDVRLLPARRPILGLPPAAAGAWAVFAEDSLLAAGAAADLRDVRVVNAAGEAIPYRRLDPAFHDDLLVPVSGGGWSAPPDTLRAAEAGNWTGYLRLGDAGPGVPVIGLPAGTSPWNWTVEGSVDGATWSAASLEPWNVDTRHIATNSSTYWTMRPPTVRFLRVAVPEPSADGRVPEPSLHRWERRAVPVVPTAFRVASAGYAGRTWRAVLEVDGGPRALSWLRLGWPGGGERGTHRLEVRDEEGTWRAVATAPPAAEGGPTAAPEGGVVRWMGPRADAVRITVEGGDSPNDPVRVLGLGWTPARFLFHAVESPLWVAYGDEYVPAPGGAPDLAAGGGEELLPSTLGPEEPNPHYTPPGFGIRWLVRRPAILTLTMAVTLAVVLWVALRSRATRAESAE